MRKPPGPDGAGGSVFGPGRGRCPVALCATPRDIFTKLKASSQPRVAMRVVVKIDGLAMRGGAGGALNPELLFAAGYAACFHSALLSVARREKVQLHDTSVGARVGIGPNGDGGFGLAVELEVVIPDVAADQAQALADAAHLVCPYSNATRGNIEVIVRVVED